MKKKYFLFNIGIGIAFLLISSFSFPLMTQYDPHLAYDYFGELHQEFKDADKSNKLDGLPMMGALIEGLISHGQKLLIICFISSVLLLVSGIIGLKNNTKP